MTGSITSTPGLQRLHDAMARRVAQHQLPGMVWLVAHGNDEAFVRRHRQLRIRQQSADAPRHYLPHRFAHQAHSGDGDDDARRGRRLSLDEPVEKYLPELANRRVLKRIDGPVDDTKPANRPIIVEDLLTFKIGYGLVFDGYEEAKYPVVERANGLQLVLSRPTPAHRTHRTSGSSASARCRSCSTWRAVDVQHRYAGAWRAGCSRRRPAAGVRAPRADIRSARHARNRLCHDDGKSRPAFPGITGTTSSSRARCPRSGRCRRHFRPARAACCQPSTRAYHTFGRLLLNKGRHANGQLLSETSVERMTTNHLTPEQIAGAGFLLNGEGWGYGMAVTVKPDEVSPVPGRYGWSGGYGTAWFNDPHRNLTAIAMTQVVEFLFAGGLTEFEKFAMDA